ncbi:putative sulfate exporter family transporter [Chitinophaga polysaccharea]|uniref:YeiH family protein n=1 Tax=Chitinophaga TaxID=79328 RepID=UPI001455C09A|nr:MULTISPECIES: putative sulfate exporter family transporter [Chitinophaga]NLR57044.1 putative sulfate exporter family transporter [Chitinophaga polysaccharea]NLU91831.1 putative sulfate exporter family transporter [Chitinophaga sp. Ak27]
MQHHQISEHWLTAFTPKIIFVTAAAVTLLPVVPPPVALLMGFALAQTTGNPFAAVTPRITHWLLQLSIIGMGFGMNVHSALKAGREGFLFTVAAIAATLLTGALLGKLLGVDKHTAHLVSCGTAICGGSAIAAIAPVMKAGEKQISVALGIIFLLNALALFIFPAVGHALHLTQQQFGLWSAIAIHDTSSVIGAANKYGEEALQIATTVKLSRALWIIPVAFATTLLFKTDTGKIKIPWFIGIFIIAMLFNTWVPQVQALAPLMVKGAKTGLSLTLFLIGTNLTREALRGIGRKPLLHGILLWVLISIGTLIAIRCLV